MSRMLDRLSLRLMAGLGVASVMAGFGWGMIKVGVPFPDPTPEQAAAERFHIGVLDTFVFAGLVILLLVGVLALVRGLSRPRGAQADASGSGDHDARS